MRVGNLNDPIQETKATEAIGISIGGRIRVKVGSNFRYDDVNWRKDSVDTLEDGPRGNLLMEVDWIGIDKESGYTITRVQTYEVDEYYEIKGLLSDRVMEEAQFGSIAGGRYYDGS